MNKLLSLPWKWIGVAVGALLLVVGVVTLIHGYGSSRYKTGQLDERIVWQKIVAEQQAKLDKLQRAADANLEAQKNHDAAALAASRKELDNALSVIPDQDTTARQRARACFELRKRGQATAACDADAAR